MNLPIVAFALQEITAFAWLGQTDPAKGLESRPAKGPILVRHILTHTAGFSYAINGDGPLEKEYRRLGLQAMSGGALVTPGETLAPELATYMKLLAKLPLPQIPTTPIRSRSTKGRVPRKSTAALKSSE